MKQIYILLIAMCAIAFTACSKDDTDDPELEGSITMCFSTENGSSLAVELETHGIGTGIIDWGDGSYQKNLIWFRNLIHIRRMVIM